MCIFGVRLSAPESGFVFHLILRFRCPPFFLFLVDCGAANRRKVELRQVLGRQPCCRNSDVADCGAAIREKFEKMGTNLKDFVVTLWRAAVCTFHRAPQECENKARGSSQIDVPASENGHKTRKSRSGMTASSRPPPSAHAYTTHRSGTDILGKLPAQVSGWRGKMTDPGETLGRSAAQLKNGLGKPVFIGQVAIQLDTCLHLVIILVSCLYSCAAAQSSKKRRRKPIKLDGHPSAHLQPASLNLAFVSTSFSKINSSFHFVTFPWHCCSRQLTYSKNLCNIVCGRSQKKIRLTQW